MFDTPNLKPNTPCTDEVKFVPSPTPSASDLCMDDNPSPLRSESPPLQTKDESISTSLYPGVYFKNEMEIEEFHAIFTSENISIPKVIKAVEIILRRGKENANLSLLRRILEAYNCDDWKSYQYWDPECKYTRNLVSTDNHHYTLMLLCWNTEKESPVHNHPQCECFVRCLQGEIQETRYAWPTAETEHLPLSVLCQNQSMPGDVTLMNDSLGLHKITNVGTIGAVTLHLYFPPYKSCKLFLDCTGKESISNVCFHTVYGHPTH